MKLRELIADQRFQVSIVVVVALLRLVNLGYLDLQPWDESLYAVRAQTVVKFGDWLDQTAHSIDGQYSPTHPPLYVWLTALAYKVFGVSEFSARFFSAIFGAATIILVYLFGRKFFSHRAGVIAALFLGLNPFYTFWTRQGQFDAMLVFFLTVAAYFYVLSIDSEKPWRCYLVTGAAIGLGLMTKLFVCLIFPFVALGALLAFDRGRWPRHLQAIIVSGAVAAAIALPWHVMMTLRYGDGNPLYFVAAAQLLERTLTGIEENVKTLGPLYYPNQLIVAFPYAVVFFLYESWKVAQRRGFSGASFIFSWFWIYFVVFSAIRTKLAVYILPLSVPVALLAAGSVDKLVKEEIPRKVHLLLLTLTVIFVGWSLRNEWRIATKNVIAALARLDAPAIADLYAVGLFALLSLFSVLVLVELLKGERTHRWLTTRLPPLLLVPLFLLLLGSVAIFDQIRYRDGAKHLADTLGELSYSELYVVGFERNPQLTYYLDGADLGWHPAHFVMRMQLEAGRDRIRDFLATRVSRTGRFYVVLERLALRNSGINQYGDVLPPGFQLMLETRGYALFQKQELFAHSP